VRHPDYARQVLWLVVSRPGQGRERWYLLTTEPMALQPDAWQIIVAYARRWQIEMAWRYGKAELAVESPRLWSWQNRLRLLLIVALGARDSGSLIHRLPYPFLGTIDDVRCYCRALSPEEVRALAVRRRVYLPLVMQNADLSRFLTGAAR
jgi:hypothetical protein